VSSLLRLGLVSSRGLRAIARPAAAGDSPLGLFDGGDLLLGLGQQLQREL